MKTVKRYTTFEDLKAVEKKSSDNRVSLKRHNEFKEIIMHIYSIKTGKAQFNNQVSLDGE